MISHDLDAEDSTNRGQPRLSKVVTGKFSKEETEKIKKSVHEYCDARGISVARLCSECEHKAELKGAWMEIAKVLPHRSVQSVYRHGLRQLHPFKRGIWTEEECERLELLVAHMGKKWATIQDKLNRSADACRDKYREMSNTYTRGRWKDNETEMLKRIIREFLKVEPNADIKELGRMVEAKRIKIPWSVVSKKMVKRSRLSCFKKWQKMTGLMSPSDLMKTERRGSKTDDSNDEDGEMMVEEEPPSRRTKDIVPTLPTHAAPTAGAAAALVSSMNESMPSQAPPSDHDFYLLTELANMDAARMSEVEWQSIRVENAQERWIELMEDFEESAPDESIMSLPLSSLAATILESKTSAQQAAETVEAVDLPNPESLHPRGDQV